jgi:DNA-binding MarR family transcriptional regulator
VSLTPQNLKTSKPQNPRGVRHPGVLAWLRLARVFQKIERISAQGFRCRDLSPAQFDILAHVVGSEGATQQDVADSLLVTKGNICQLLDRMEQAGLLERRQEGRANRLFLTDKGRKLSSELIPEHEEVIVQAFTSLTVDEQAQLLILLRKLDHALT